MNQDRKRLAEFFARLASKPILPDQADLKGEDGHAFDRRSEIFSKNQPLHLSRHEPALFREFMRLKKVPPKLTGYEPGPDPVIGDPSSPLSNKKFRAELYLYEAWSEVWTVLNDLLDGRQTRAMYRQPVFRLVDGSLREAVSDQLSGSLALLTAFYSILREKPFPFGRCPICRTIFVRVRRQRYCSPGCASRGHEVARKETKRDYMRKYMAMRRAKERAAQRKGR